MTASTGSRTRDPRLQLGHALPVRSVNAGHAPLPAVPASNACRGSRFNESARCAGLPEAWLRRFRGQKQTLTLVEVIPKPISILYH